MPKEFRQMNVPAVVHTADDKIFFPGPAHLTEADAKQIESELKRQEGIGVADSKVRDDEDEAQVDEDTIPSSFPHAGDLRNNEVTSMTQLRAMSREDLIALKHIGPAKADEIESALLAE